MEGKRGRDALKRPEIKIVEYGEGRECQREWRCYAGLAECAPSLTLLVRVYVCEGLVER